LARADHVRKFRQLTDGIVSEAETSRFMESVEALPRLDAAEVCRLGIQLAAAPGEATSHRAGIF
jgi:2-methylcitrate dehydratase